MFKKILFLALMAALQQVKAQAPYPAGQIPEALKNRAHAVIRDMETTVDMLSADQVIMHVKQVITVLNKNGDDMAALTLYYGNNTTIKNIKGSVYDEYGKPLFKFNQQDFKDESAISSFSLFEEERLKHYQPSVIQYPYTVIYDYEIKSKQNLIIPDWCPVPGAHVSVERSSYTFTCKPSDKVRIKVYNDLGKPTETKTDKLLTQVWEVKQLPALKTEPYSLAPENYLPFVRIAPEKFSYYKTNGNYSNWEELGKWIYKDLIGKRQVLSPATVQTIQELVKGKTDPKEKAKIIYEFVQKKTRYVSVQIGIGGFQPMLASEVDQLGYGDCKALVNYMQSLLKVVDIPSYYCIVYAGNQKKNLDSEFASMNQANHVVLCLPLKGDTTWLECTSQTAPFGYLGDFTDDRLVLACSPEGGKLLRTPASANHQNLSRRNAELHIDQQGNISGKMSTLFKGSQYDNDDYIISLSPDKQEQALKERYDIDNINFHDIKFSQQKDLDPVTVESSGLNIKNYVPKTQNRAYLVMNVFNKMGSLAKVTQRTKSLYLNRGYMDEDVIIYHLPEGFKIEAKPADVHMATDFGSYSISMALQGDTLTYSRSFRLNNGQFPASRYAEFVAFINQANEHDHAKLILSTN